MIIDKNHLFVINASFITPHVLGIMHRIPFGLLCTKKFLSLRYTAPNSSSSYTRT